MNESLLKKGSARIVALCVFIYSMSYIGRLNFSACMSEIMLSTAMERTFAGTISTGYLACYGAGQFINGMIGDKISPKYMIFTGLFMSGCMNISMGFSSNHILLLIIWCLNGYFHSMLWSPLIRSFSEWLPKEKQNSAGVSLSPTIPMGTIFAYAISAFFLKIATWRVVFFVCGAILILSSLIWYAGISSIREYIKNIGKYKEDSDLAKNGLTADEDKGKGDKIYPEKKVSLISLIAGTGLIFAAIGILFNGILKDGVTQWVPTYISESFGVEASIAASASILLPIINLTGPYLAVWLNKRLKNEMTVSYLMFGISVVSIGVLCLLSSAGIVNAAGLIAAVVLIAVCTSAMHGANSMFLTFIPFHFSSIGKSASVTGFLNSCSYLASALSSVTIGYIAENSGWSVTILSWGIVAAIGFVVCIIGKPFWKKGRKLLD